jgi:enoyl-[acyl-carrier protein] reductase III
MASRELRRDRRTEKAGRGYALRQIPGYEKIMEVARQRNPKRRLTQPEDVRCIAALCHPATYWRTGNTLHVDGGENIVGRIA